MSGGNGDLTQDIKPHWFNLIRRLQAAARCQSGHAIITISIVVDADGKPIAWTEPQTTKMEPMSSTHEWITVILNGKE